MINALLKRWGPLGLRKRVWDKEFSSGKWDYMDPKASRKGGRDVVLDVLDRYSSGAHILDLGCGSGATGLELADGYQSYVGVDISEVAVAKAGSVLCPGPKKATNKYLVGDVLTFVPLAKYSIILFRESLYYCPDRNIAALLSRYSGYLSPDGVFVVRLHDRVKYQKIVQLIKSAYRIVECVAPADGSTIVIVFSPVAERVMQ